RGYLREIGEESARNGYRRVLIEEALEGPRLYSGDVLALIRERGPDARIFERIAYVDTHIGEAAPNMEFAALVAADFGLNVRAFGDLEAARGWLLETAAAPESGGNT
ncbi:MAG TPA: hypothetical protein VFR86_26035, partial [Burkholderiaceae bacterium]|nr:hypothetical protein [Burkholderiaceae bacterium]